LLSLKKLCLPIQVHLSLCYCCGSLNTWLSKWGKPRRETQSPFRHPMFVSHCDAPVQRGNRRRGSTRRQNGRQPPKRPTKYLTPPGKKRDNAPLSRLHGDGISTIGPLGNTTLRPSIYATGNHRLRNLLLAHVPTLPQP